MPRLSSPRRSHLLLGSAYSSSPSTYLWYPSLFIPRSLRTRPRAVILLADRPRLCHARAVVAIRSLLSSSSFLVRADFTRLCCSTRRLLFAIFVSVALSSVRIYRCFSSVSLFLSLCGALWSSPPSSLTGISAVSFSSALAVSLLSPQRSSLAPRCEYLSSPASAADVPLPVRPRRFARYPPSAWNVGAAFCVSAGYLPRSVPRFPTSLPAIAVLVSLFLSSPHVPRPNRLTINASGKTIARGTCARNKFAADVSFRDTRSCIFAPSPPSSISV